MPLESLWYANMTKKPTVRHARHAIKEFRLIMRSLSVLDKSVREGKEWWTMLHGFVLCKVLKPWHQATTSRKNSTIQRSTSTRARGFSHRESCDVERSTDFECDECAPCMHLDHHEAVEATTDTVREALAFRRATSFLQRSWINAAMDIFALHP
jgi:hypothetical protein